MLLPPVTSRLRQKSSRTRFKLADVLAVDFDSRKLKVLCFPLSEICFLAARRFVVFSKAFLLNELSGRGATAPIKGKYATSNGESTNQ